MKIIKQGPGIIPGVVKTLMTGGLVIFPCETVYGIASDAFNRKAVVKLNKYKERPLGKPYAIMVSDRKMAESCVRLNKTAKNLYRRFLPGPVTVISKGKHIIAKGIESETGTLGVRIPDYPFMIELIRKFGRPIAATSGNASYKKRPYKISDILDNVSDKQKKLIDLIIDAGELPHNEPSTVIDTTLDDPVVLRQGEIKFKRKSQVLSRSEENTQNVAKELFQKYESYLGKRPLVFALDGNLGVGKTQFTKGLAQAMGITETVVSPTFNLVLEYQSLTINHQPLTHIDAWRLQNPEELETLGFLQMIEDKNMVIAIEWADRVSDIIRKYKEYAVVIWVKIEFGKEENERLISWNTI